jgi:probable HAF family extracellular repeat protein
LTAIGTPGASGFTPTAINNLGQIVGYSNIGTPSLPQYSSALYSGGSFTALSGPGGLGGGVNGFRVVDINDSGQIVGNAYSNDIAKIGFLYSGGVYNPLRLPDDTGSAVTAINNRGQVIGASSIRNGTLGGSTGFLYSDGTMTSLEMPPPTPDPYAPYPTYYGSPMSINDSGVVVGTVSFIANGIVTKSAKWFNGDLTAVSFVTPARRTPHLAINNSGVIVGWVESIVDTQGLLYADGVELNLNTVVGASLGASGYVRARSINDLNMVVGEFLQGNVIKAFLYNFESISNPGQAILLEDLITLSDGTTPGFTSLDTATDINNLGQIVGMGTYFDGVNTFSAPYMLQGASVPEPSTLTLFFTAVVALVAFRRRWRHQLPPSDLTRNSV